MIAGGVVGQIRHTFWVGLTNSYRHRWLASDCQYPRDGGSVVYRVYIDSSDLFYIKALVPVVVSSDYHGAGESCGATQLAWDPVPRCSEQRLLIEILSDRKDGRWAAQLQPVRNRRGQRPSAGCPSFDGSKADFTFSLRGQCDDLSYTTCNIMTRAPCR